MDVFRVKNYRTFSEMLKKKTGCDIIIKIMEIQREHFHFQLNKDGIAMGVLCIDNGEASFAPFVTHENARNEQFINVQYMPMLEEFISVLKVFSEIFVIDEEECF